MKAILGLLWVKVDLKMILIINRLIVLSKICTLDQIITYLYLKTNNLINIWIKYLHYLQKRITLYFIIKIIKKIQLNYKMIFEIFINKIRAIAENKKRG